MIGSGHFAQLFLNVHTRRASDERCLAKNINRNRNRNRNKNLIFNDNVDENNQRQIKQDHDP